MAATTAYIQSLPVITASNLLFEQHQLSLKYKVNNDFECLFKKDKEFWLAMKTLICIISQILMQGSEYTKILKIQ
jgi:hypothetical protein